MNLLYNPSHSPKSTTKVNSNVNDDNGLERIPVEDKGRCANKYVSFSSDTYDNYSTTKDISVTEKCFISSENVQNCPNNAKIASDRQTMAHYLTMMALAKTCSDPAIVEFIREAWRLVDRGVPE